MTVSAFGNDAIFKEGRQTFYIVLQAGNVCLTNSAVIEFRKGGARGLLESFTPVSFAAGF